MISKLLKKDKKGFTLMEMLIVVAIIAILIAIMIPTFNAQLEKAREAADAANIRAAYAEVMVKYLDTNPTEALTESVTLQQAQDGWKTPGIADSIAKLGTVTGTPSAKGTCTITVSTEGTATIEFKAANP